MLFLSCVCQCLIDLCREEACRRTQTRVYLPHTVLSCLQTACRWPAAAGSLHHSWPNTTGNTSHSDRKHITFRQEHITFRQETHHIQTGNTSRSDRKHLQIMRRSGCELVFYCHILDHIKLTVSPYYQYYNFKINFAFRNTTLVIYPLFNN